MPRSPVPDPATRLLPPGQRWGFGAHSVLPYLAHALHGRPGEPTGEGGAIRNPVFAQMEDTLRSPRRPH